METTVVNIKEFDAEEWSLFKAEATTRRLTVKEAAKQELKEAIKNGNKSEIRNKYFNEYLERKRR